MPIHVDWGNLEETLIVWQFRGQWSEQDFYEAVEQSATLTRRSSHTVDYLIDLRQSISSPGNLLAMTRSAMQNHHFANQGQTVVITRSSFWQQLFNTLMMTIRHYRGDIVFVDSVDAAYRRIQHKHNTRYQKAVGD